MKLFGKIFAIYLTNSSSRTMKTTMPLARIIHYNNIDFNGNLFSNVPLILLMMMMMLILLISTISCDNHNQTTHQNNHHHNPNVHSRNSHQSSSSSSSSSSNRTNESFLASQHYNRILKFAKCQHPYARVVNIQNELHASAIKKYIPHCTILHHCGAHTGCCRLETEQCVPKTVEDVKLYFWTIEVTPRGHKKGIEVITMKNHTECMCAPISSISVKNRDDSDKQHFHSTKPMRPTTLRSEDQGQTTQSPILDQGVPLVQIQTSNSAHSPPSTIHHYNT